MVVQKAVAETVELVGGRYGKGVFFLGWHEIRQTLFESLPEGMVEFGRKFDCYEVHGAQGVTMRFQVWPSMH